MKKINITENDLAEIIEQACEKGMQIQRTINDFSMIPYKRIEIYQKTIIKKLNIQNSMNNFVCQNCQTEEKCSKQCKTK